MLQASDIQKTTTITYETSGLLPLLNVLRWDLRRRLHQASFWIAPVILFALFCLLTWVGRQKGPMLSDGIWIDEVTPVGVMSEIVGVLIPLFGLIIPFIGTDRVAQDFKQRTHELLMTTQVPTWAYILGRYLAGLVVLGILLLAMLAGFLLMAFLLHSPLPLDQYLDVPGYAQLGYPAPNIGAILSIWLITILPFTLLVYSPSFTLGTFFPASTNLVKALLVIALIGLWIYSPRIFSGPAAPWDPTSFALSVSSSVQVAEKYQTRIRQEKVTDPRQRLLIARQIEEEMPDMSSWWAPRALYLIVSGMIVVIAVSRFQRFRQQINA